MTIKLLHNKKKSKNIETKSSLMESSLRYETMVMNDLRHECDIIIGEGLSRHCWSLNRLISYMQKAGDC